MADSNFVGGEGDENRVLVIPFDPTVFSIDELFGSHLPDQETTAPEQNLHRGFDPPAGLNGCLPEPGIDQGPNQAAALTQWSIGQQHSGQSPGIFTENLSSQIPDSVLKKRGYNKTYREKKNKQKHELEEQNKSLEAENGRLEGEKHELEEQKKSLEAENRRLKREKHEHEEQMKSFEGKNGRLQRKKQEFEEQMKSKLDAFEAGLKHEIRVKEEKMKFTWAIEFELLRDEFDSLRRDDARELAQLRNKVDKLGLKQQNQRTKDKRSMSSSKEFWAESEEEDSVHSAKKFRASEKQIFANKKVPASSDRMKAFAIERSKRRSTQRLKRSQRMMRKAEELAVRLKREIKRLKSEVKRLKSEGPGNTNTSMADLLKIKSVQIVEQVGPVHESNNGRGMALEVERLESQVRGTIDAPDNNALIVDVSKSGPDSTVEPVILAHKSNNSSGEHSEPDKTV